MVNTSGGSSRRGLSARTGVLKSRPHPTLIGTMLRAGRIREAIGIGEATLARGTATRDECESLATAYWALGMGRSAERLADGLCKQSTPSIEALVLLGEIYQVRMWASQLQTVLRRLATVARRHPKIREFSQALETLGVESHPPEDGDTRAQLRRAEWYLRRGWTGEAEAVLKKVLQAHPDDERGQSLMWGCMRERKLEARFGPLAMQNQGDEGLAEASSEAVSGGHAGDEAVDPANFASMIQPVQVIEAAAEEEDDDDDYEDVDEDDDDWGDDGFEDLDDEEDESEVSIGFARQVHLSISAKGRGPSPALEREKDEVIVIERGDQPRIIGAEGANAKGIWFRGSRDLIQDRIPMAGERAGEGKPEGKALSVAINPSKDRQTMSAKSDQGDKKKSGAYLQVGRYGFDEDEEDAKATEVVAHFTPPRGNVVQLGRQAPPSPPEDWEEGPTQAVEEVALLNMFVEDDEEGNRTRIVNLSDEEDGATRIVDGVQWEGDVATRVAGLDEFDAKKVAGPNESTRVLSVRKAPQQLAHNESTVALNVPPKPPSTTPTKAEKPLYASTTQQAASKPGAYATVPLAVPSEPSYLASPALLLSILIFGAVAFSFLSWQDGQRQAELDLVGGQVEALLLKGDSSSYVDASNIVREVIEKKREPDPVFEAMSARIAWAKWAETGGALELGPSESELKDLRIQLESNRDLFLAQGYYDLFAGDHIRGVVRLEDALRAIPKDVLLGTLLAETLLQSPNEESVTQAANLIEKVKGWMDEQPLQVGPNKEGLQPLVESRVAFVSALLALRMNDPAAAAAQLRTVAFLNAAHPLLPAYEAFVQIPPGSSPEDALGSLEAAYAALPATAAPRARATLLAWQMDYAESAGQLDKAVGFADRLMAADPGWPEGLWRSAEAQLRRGDHALARQRIVKAGELAKFNMKVLEDQVFLLIDHQELGAAEVLLSAIPRALENQAPVLRARAEVAVARRDLSKAEALLKEAKVLAPNELKTLGLESQVGALLEGARAGKPPLDAILERDETLDMDLSRARTFARLAVLSSGSAASNLAKKALKAAPKDPAVREILAEGYEVSGNRRTAIKELKESLKVAPNRVTSLALLAKLYALDGNKEEALGYWEQAASSCTEGALCNEVATLLR